METSLLKQINETVLANQTLFEAIDALVPSEDFLETLSLTLNESAEHLLGKAYAQVNAGKSVDPRTADVVVGLFALGDPNAKDKINQQLKTLGKQGTPLMVALQLAGDDEAVNDVLQKAGAEYAQASGQGAPFQLKNLMLGGNVLDQNQRTALGQRLQRAQTSFRNAAAKLTAAQQPQQASGGASAMAAPASTKAPAAAPRPMNMATATTGAPAAAPAM